MKDGIRLGPFWGTDRTVKERTWAERYLSLIGVEEEAPGLEGLGRLVRAHVQNVPFENSGSLLRRHEAGVGPVRAIDSETLLASWEARRSGGVCFEHAEMFGRLLVELGYAVTPIAGEISFPGSHQALVVDLGGARWLVDVGNGAPFFEPIPLDRPLEIHRLGLGFRFAVDPGDPGVWIQERATEGGWKPYCRYILRPQSPQDREVAYQRHHRPRDTWVTNSSSSSGAGRRNCWSSGTWTSSATRPAARSRRGSRTRTAGLACRDRSAFQHSRSATSPAPGRTSTVHLCPGASDGETLVFTTTDDVAALRTRVRSMAEMHNEHHAAGGMHGGMMGGGMMGSGKGMAGKMKMPPSNATVADVDGGASIALTPVTPADLPQLQAAVRAHATQMQQDGCGKMAQK